MPAQTSSLDAQVNLDKLCDRVVETGEAVNVTRPAGKNVVLVSEAELSSLLETLFEQISTTKLEEEFPC